MMCQVVGPCEAQATRQLFSEMDTPVNLLQRHVIQAEGREDTRSDPEPPEPDPVADSSAV